MTNSSNISLPDSTRIRDNTVTSVLLRRSGSLTLKTAKGTVIASDAIVGTAHITFKNTNGKEVTAPIPLSVLQRDYNSPDPLCVNWKNIDLTQTTIVLDGAAATATQAFEIVFGVECDAC